MDICMENLISEFHKLPYSKRVRIHQRAFEKGMTIEYLLLADLEQWVSNPELDQSFFFAFMGPKKPTSELKVVS